MLANFLLKQFSPNDFMEQLNLIHLSLFIFILLNNQIQIYNYVHASLHLLCTLYTRMHIIIILLYVKGNPSNLK